MVKSTLKYRIHVEKKKKKSRSIADCRVNLFQQRAYPGRTTDNNELASNRATLEQDKFLPVSLNSM